MLDCRERAGLEGEHRRLIDAIPGLIWTARPDGSIDFLKSERHRAAFLRDAPDLIIVDAKPRQCNEFVLRIDPGRVVPENPIRADSRDEAESAHHPARCLHSFSCLGRLSPTCSGRGASLKSRTSFSGISSIYALTPPHTPALQPSRPGCHQMRENHSCRQSMISLGCIRFFDVDGTRKMSRSCQQTSRWL